MDNGFPAEVVVVEPTGSETQLVLRVEETKIVCVTRERLAVRAGDTIPLQVNSGNVSLFDQDTGLPFPHQ
jgi:multiple sugar transport system ATP-binding protein